MIQELQGLIAKKQAEWKKTETKVVFGENLLYLPVAKYISSLPVTVGKYLIRSGDKED